jgi:Tol biopolymer transport system component
MLAWSAGPANLDIVLHETSQGREETLGTVAEEMMPRLFPHAPEVVFVSGQTTSRNDLWVQRLDGSRASVGARQITFHQEGEVDHPAVSADGRWVAYYRVVKGTRDVWIVPSVAGPPTQITIDPASDIQPAWSHDGKHLAFASDRGGHFNIWTVPVAHGRAVGRETPVTRGDQSKLAPEWSPTDEWIAYVGGPTTADAEVWVTRADGSGTPRPVTTKAGAYRIRWLTPDRMVVSGTWGEHTLSLRFVDPETGAATQLVPPVVLGDDHSACDFDIDLDRRLAVFARSTTRLGNIWTLTKRQ